MRIRHLTAEEHIPLYTVQLGCLQGDFIFELPQSGICVEGTEHNIKQYRGRKGKGIPRPRLIY